MWTWEHLSDICLQEGKETNQTPEYGFYGERIPSNNRRVRGRLCG
jgi:hypothetical protein